MPESFYFPTPESDVFIPLDLDPARPDYRNGWLAILGRLSEGVTEAQLEEDLVRVTQALGVEYDYPAAWDKTRNPYVMRLRQYLFGEVRPALLVLLGAVGMLLLMACVNVAALLLTKTVDRSREVGLRVALRSELAAVRLVRVGLTRAVAASCTVGSCMPHGLRAYLFRTRS